MKIFLLTPVYASTTSNSGTTPVVHYFAKEWVKLGHQVCVYNLRAQYPRLFYWISRLFHHKINTRIGMLIPTEYPTPSSESVDGVDIKRICVKKIVPHSLISDKELNRIIDLISQDCERNGVPDVFLGHWDNPQLQVLIRLKNKFKRPISLVFHENTFSLENRYGSDVSEMLKHLDIIGFRNEKARLDFERKYFKPNRSFIAYSGVSKDFLKVGEAFSPTFESISRYVFVGSLIERKYPVEILKALHMSYGENLYQIVYVGDGEEKNTIVNYLNEHNIDIDKVFFTGRVQRNSVVNYIKGSQVFVMISKGEIFGLVYLEAMALGLITIGSRNEGIDGIIIDGENGFLCEAGNGEELASILKRIQTMSSEDLTLMSLKAKKTAALYSDNNVAKSYLDQINKYELDC